ncbi:MAG: hypothetical protein IPM48_05395 [Saprospiraceae bacterium]|nr:hypothetical protein [Saprospiraceae bacterium]
MTKIINIYHIAISIFMAIVILSQCKFEIKENQPNVLGTQNPFYGMFEVPTDLKLPLIQNVPNFRNQDSLVLYLQNNADEFSWRTFVAICWPSNENGKPDTNSSFALESNHVVFEYWMPGAKVYPKDGRIPQSWEEHIGSRGNNIVAYVASELRTIAKLNTFENKEADHHLLTDQNHNHTLYQVFYNREAFEYVVRAKLYNLDGQKEFVKNWPSATRGLKVIENGKEIGIEERYKRAYFSIGNSVDSSFKLLGGDYYFLKNPNSSIIKSAWRIMTPNDDKRRYFIRKVFNDSNTIIEIGLVGIHIAQKVSEATQWVWSSFEHIDNAPLLGPDGKPMVVDSMKYSYYNKENLDTSTYNQAFTIKMHQDVQKKTPNQVVRINPIAASTQEITQKYWEKIRAVNPNSPWQYYQLVGTQWPFDPTLFTSGDRYTPTLMANTVLETFDQKTSSCMGCHSQARFMTSDTSTNGYGYNADFIWGLTNVK